MIYASYGMSLPRSLFQCNLVFSCILRIQGKIKVAVSILPYGIGSFLCSWNVILSQYIATLYYLSPSSSRALYDGKLSLDQGNDFMLLDSYIVGINDFVNILWCLFSNITYI